MNSRFLGLIETSIKFHWDLPALSDIGGENYLYKDFAAQIEKLHILMEISEIHPKDKLAIVGANSAHWAICFFSILTYGATAVPILHEFNSDNIHHIINHSSAKVLFISSSCWKELQQTAIPKVKLIVLIDDFSIIYAASAEANKADLTQLFNLRYPIFSPESIHYYIEQPDDLAILNYTSGTTSSSKGVMIPFRSLWSNTLFAQDNLSFVHKGDNIVCLLPMAHMYGLAFEVLNSINKGCHIHFIKGKPSPRVVMEAFKEFRPSLILAVPLIIEKIVKDRIFPKINKPFLRFMLRLPGIRTVIRKQIKREMEEAFGSHFEEIVLGGAALNKEVEQFLHSIHFRYTVGYGMTECGPLIAYAQWDEFKLGSVGRVVDRMEIRIDSDKPHEKVGEIWVRGTNNMLGYYKNPEATHAVMTTDGWMKTGDLGIIDSDGFLYIRGRCKTMILSANGQNIYPEEIENKLNSLPLISESLVISDNKKLTALIYPNWAKIREDKMTNEQLNNIMKQYITQVNKCIPRYCKISSFTLQDKEFEKTPKRSIKRYLYQPQL